MDDNESMSTKTTITIALAAGFAGGFVSQRLAPTPAYAQTSVPKELRAEKFVLTDEKGTPRGAFGIGGKGFPTVEVTDAKGRVFWIQWHSDPGKGKSTLIPHQ